MSLSRSLLILALALFAALVLLGILGERLLPMFGGDRAAAGKAMKLVFAGLGGAALACAQPAIWQAFARRARAMIETGQSRSGFAGWLQDILTPERATTVGFAALIFCAVATLCLIWLISTGRA